MLIMWRDGRLSRQWVFAGAACLLMSPLFAASVRSPLWTLTFASSYFWGIKQYSQRWRALRQTYRSSVDFIGGLFTAVIAFVLLLKINVTLTLLALGFVTIFGFVLRKAFKSIRPIFRERGKINAEVTGRLTESQRQASHCPK